MAIVLRHRVLDSTVTVHAVGKPIELFTVDGSLNVLWMRLRSGVETHEWQVSEFIQEIIGTRITLSVQLP